MANTPTTNSSVASLLTDEDIGEYAETEAAKRKQILNYDRYKTADEAYTAFIEFCCKYKCRNCRFGNRVKPVGCALEWLYDEAEKEETK